MEQIIRDLLEEGRVVVLKAGEKATPEQLAMAVLAYCEGAGFTLEDTFNVSNKIRNAAWDAREKKCKGIRFSIVKDAEEQPPQEFTY